jgi:hypothetical protein
MSSFTVKNTDYFIGTYSVSASDPSQIKLIINSDHTFYYQDFSVSEKKIVIKGNWTVRGNKVILKDNDSNLKFHNVWTFDKNGQKAKSRRGLTFYRLCKINK